MKPQYSDEEVEELNDLHQDFGYMAGIHEVKIFLQKHFGWSDVHNVITELRKEFDNKRLRIKQEKFRETYKDSTLFKTLHARLEWTQAQKQNNE
jgi:hypothetical protein